MIYHTRHATRDEIDDARSLCETTASLTRGENTAVSIPLQVLASLVYSADMWEEHGNTSAPAPTATDTAG